MQTYQYIATAVLREWIDITWDKEAVDQRVSFHGSVEGSYSELTALDYARANSRAWLEDIYSLYDIISLEVRIIDDFIEKE